jgi:hypothetical protein
MPRNIDIGITNGVVIVETAGIFRQVLVGRDLQGLMVLAER